MSDINDEKYRKIAYVLVKAGVSIPKFIIKQLSRLQDADFSIFINNLWRDQSSVSKVYAYCAQYFIRSLEWLPDLKEFILFASFVALIFVVLEVVHSTYINAAVRSQSRCVKYKNDKDRNKVHAYDGNGNLLYSVKYDNVKQTSDIICEGAGTGTSTNIYNVRVYDYKSNSTTTQQKKCEKQAADAKAGTDSTRDEHVYYTGDSMLVDYMKNPSNVAYFSP